jgi:hypothetical protein
MLKGSYLELDRGCWIGQMCCCLNTSLASSRPNVAFPVGCHGYHWGIWMETVATGWEKMGTNWVFIPIMESSQYTVLSYRKAAGSHLCSIVGLWSYRCSKQGPREDNLFSNWLAEVMGNHSLLRNGLNTYSKWKKYLEQRATISPSPLLQELTCSIGFGDIHCHHGRKPGPGIRYFKPVQRK